jgi:DNA-binding protein YbaB
LTINKLKQKKISNMENIETLKAKINQAKSELEKKIYNYTSHNSGTTINLRYSCYLNEITHNGKSLDVGLIEEINFAMREAKKKMEEEYFATLNAYGIKM